MGWHSAALAAYLLAITNHALATPSRDCMHHVTRALHSGQMRCEDAVCGPLRTPTDLRLTFTERLSGECKAQMDAYRMLNTTSRSDSLVAAQPGGQASKCAADLSAANPNNPVVVQSRNAAPFMMCTIPKVACTNFRKLLRVLMLYPEPLPKGADEQMWPAHFGIFPTLWQYAHADAPLTDRYPSFILGRNPYVRILSCHLDKMVFDPNKGHDWHTMGVINRQLGNKPDQTFEATPESFANFVRQVKERGVTEINNHLRMQVYVCDPQSVQYAYRLRLEEMTQWLPCVIEGLQIQRFTFRGWRERPLEWVGDDYDGCWWTPKDMSCEEFRAAASTDDGKLRPVHVESNVTQGKPWGHQTGADALVARFYTQEVADIVHAMYKPDFEAFGYKRLSFTQQEQFVRQ